jgi:hypothetical protein
VVENHEQPGAGRPDGLETVALLLRRFPSSMRSVIPITPFKGVRISWLITARNALLAWLATSAERASSFARANGVL